MLRHVIANIRRQDWTAVGIELVVVIVGVFIGVQASNWNQERETNQKAAIFTERLKADLRTEAWNYEMQVGYNEQVLANAQRAADALTGETALSDEALLIAAYRATQFNGNSRRRATYDELTSTGEIGLIRDPDLRTLAMDVYTLPQIVQIEQHGQESGYRRAFRMALPWRVQRALSDKCGDHVVMIGDFEGIKTALDYPCTTGLASDVVASSAAMLRKDPKLTALLQLRIADVATDVNNLTTYFAPYMRGPLQRLVKEKAALSLFDELKRRKVFKVGAAYLVAGWVLIQVAATVAPQMNLPDWVPRAITFAIALGFPIALVLAWIYDAGPGGIHRDVEVAAPSLGAVAFSPVAAHAIAETPADIPHKSIAVLPFVDMSPTHDQEYFSDGISEEILNALVKLKDLKVAGRTSSFSFKGKNEDLRNIAKTLSVAHVLEGSVRKHGDKVRITAQLIQADNGYHLWSENYDGDLADVFELQERIARAITRELDVILHGEQRLVPIATTSPEAYALYLQASDIFNRRDGVRFPEAIALLHRATELDPGFARAHARLAAIHALEPVYTPNLVDTAAASVQREAARASDRDPALGEPYAAIALASLQQNRFLESREAIERALKLQPDDPTTLYWVGAISISTGYIARGCAQLDRVLQVDPLYPIALLWRGMQYIQAGDPDRGRPLLKRSVATGLAHAWLGMHELTAASGRIDEAIAQLARGLTVLGAGLPEGAPEILARAVYGGTAAHAEGLALVDRFVASQPSVLPGAFAYALLLMDEGQRALELIARFRTTNDAIWFHRIWCSALRDLRRTPQFRAVVRQLGLTELWDRYGAPDGAHRDDSGEYVWE